MWLMAGALVYAQSIDNPSFNGTSGWTFLDEAQLVAAGGRPDCSPVPLTASPDGGLFLRALAFGDLNQGASTIVTGLVVGVPYVVRFEQALMRHYGQSPGHWQVSIDGFYFNGPTLELPDDNPAQTEWEQVTVGPFVYRDANPSLAFTAHSEGGGDEVSTGLPNVDLGCNYVSNLEATDLLLDGIVVTGDLDGDGLYGDEEEALGTDPERADTDEDGLPDAEELALSTAPLDSDTDDDELLDGSEGDYGADPLRPDTDEDTLLDGIEVQLGIDPTLPDTDGNGFSDAAEVGSGSDPGDAGSVPQGQQGEPPQGDAPPDDRFPGRDEGSKGAVGCGCDAGTVSGPPWAWALALLLGWRQRRDRSCS